MPEKKVLLFVIDALASRVVQPLMRDGKLPAMAALADAGGIHWDCTPIFPSITPAATASIITGQYPVEHGIIGDYWYDRERNEVRYFGADFSVIWNQGFGSFFHDFLDRLNEQFLSSETLFEAVESAGLSAASFNYLIFHGNVAHEVEVPLLLKLLPNVSFDRSLHGPQILQLGDFVVPAQLGRNGGLHQSGPKNRYGFRDYHAAQALLELAQTENLPDLTVTYWPDNDFNSHADGPVASGTTIQQADMYLQQLFDTVGGLEQLLQEYCVVLTGDHSQADMIADEDQAGIDLHRLLDEYSIADPGQPWQDEDLLICPNLRVAHAYLPNQDEQRIKRMAELLLADERIDQVLWPAPLTDGAPGFVVATLHRGRLRFGEGEHGAEQAQDDYGTTWSWEGDLSVVDGQIDGEQIRFGDYPNAFERIANALTNSTGGVFWMTARPGYEFLLPGMNAHPGGSHGSLHRLDSQVPLLIAGAPSAIAAPEHPRTIDVAPFCKQVLGIS